MIEWVQPHWELAWWPQPTHNDLAHNLEVKANDFPLGFSATQKKTSEIGPEYLTSQTWCVACQGPAPTPQPQQAR